MLFKNLKGLQIIGKGGEIASPLPSRKAVKSLRLAMVEMPCEDAYLPESER